MQRINHLQGYSIGGACTNGAESYFSRLRRGELGHHYHIAVPYLARYAQEAAGREDLRRSSNSEQVSGVATLAMRVRPRSIFAATGNGLRPKRCDSVSAFTDALAEHEIPLPCT